MSRRLLAALAVAVTAAALAVPAAAAVSGSGSGERACGVAHRSAVASRNSHCGQAPHGGYLVGAAVESINPSAAMLARGDFYLGGYGLTSTQVANRPEGQIPGLSPRRAVGILGQGVATRALVVSDGQTAITLAQIDVQGYFSAYKQGPFGLVDIRNDAARQIAALRAKQGKQAGPVMGAGQILVDSNHTHGGPDTAGVWGGVPTAYLRLVHDRTVQAIVEAWQQLQPADLFYGTTKAGVSGVDPDGSDPLTSNQFRDDPANAAMDDELRVLQARDAKTGATIITYVNLSAHATVLGGDNRHVTADYTGPLSSRLGQTYGGIGFQQVGTLGRSQPNRAGCPDRALAGKNDSDPAEATCKLDAYAARVAAKVATALSAARRLDGKPVVAMHSYLMNDVGTNAPLIGLIYAGSPIGAPIFRSIAPPWAEGTNIGSPSFSGRIGDLLISGSPGEAYPQIPLKVRQVVSERPGNAIRGFLSVGTAGDFLGYIIAPFEAYPQPIVRTPSNDNYFFNASHTFGERLTCSLLRGAGEVLGAGPDAYWSGYDRCTLFANDHLLPADYDTTFPPSPDISGTPLETIFGGR